MNNDNTTGFVVTFIIVICLSGITNIHIVKQFEGSHQYIEQIYNENVILDLQKELEFCQRNINQNVILCEDYLVTTNNIQTIVDGYTNIETGGWEVIETYTGESK